MSNKSAPPRRIKSNRIKSNQTHKLLAFTLVDQLDASTGPGNLLKLSVRQLIIDTQPRLHASLRVFDHVIASFSSTYTHPHPLDLFEARAVKPRRNDVGFPSRSGGGFSLHWVRARGEIIFYPELDAYTTNQPEFEFDSGRDCYLKILE
jgi:hypothetical protein